MQAHLLEMTGDTTAAREAYLAAARRATNLPQQRYLNRQAARLGDNISTRGLVRISADTVLRF